MSERKVAVVRLEFYLEGYPNEFHDKTDAIFEAFENIIDCPDCEPDHDCDDDCEHRCNMLGASARCMTEEEFDREFLSDE